MIFSKYIKRNAKNILSVFSGKVFHRTLIDPVLLARKGYEEFCLSGGETGALSPLYLREADVSCSHRKKREIIYQTEDK